MLTTETTLTHVRPSVGATLLLIVGAVAFLAVLFSLYSLLSIGMPYMGLLFLLYWAAILRQDFQTYLPSLLGGIVGILLGWLLVAMPLIAERAGTVISYAALGAVLFCFIRGQVSLLVNNSTMLFVLVATIPELHIADNVVMMMESLVLSAVYMGAVAGVMHIRAKQGSKGTKAQPHTNAQKFH